MSDEMLMQMMDPGAGFSLASTQEEDKKVTINGGPEVTADESDDSVSEEKDARGRTVWYDEPSFDDQYEKYPSTTRLVGPQLAVFNIADPGQLDALNKLLLKQQPKESPSVVLINKKENFFQGTWLMSVEYFKIQYKKLISTN